ncbi:hypothetical protein Cob_v006104 [Colletotrichum orbiculare MAFF 240422]|uniref:Uncharacterized protein n=1 Tax=Colletotrichum orbiculare (strain 104-T / ATCC 96160 / CBS 514.97 / LARS 414 / MAFF 240422) TaxID=1213857 RepID=A0A484FRK9_COLOR|nr:hypothetical protein Cob_v006104 [Colletotrichum orbiculare MAFF 240422]
MAKSPRPHARAVRNSNSSQASVALRAMPQVKRCGYYLEKSAATAALPAAKPASFESPKLSRSPYTVKKGRNKTRGLSQACPMAALDAAILTPRGDVLQHSAPVTAQSEAVPTIT